MCANRETIRYAVKPNLSIGSQGDNIIALAGLDMHFHACP